MSAAIEVSAAALAAAARPLTGGPGDYDALLELVGDARFVLLGEPTHGSRSGSTASTCTACSPRCARC